MKITQSALSMIIGVMILFCCLCMYDAIHADDKAKPPTSDISVDPNTLQQMRQIYSDAIASSEALNEAKRLFTGKEDCDVRVVRTFETNAAAKQNAWIATETNTRYLSNVPKDFVFDWTKGAYRAKTPQEAAQGGNK